MTTCSDFRGSTFPSDYPKLPEDLNKGCGGAYIYLGYKKDKSF